MNKINLDNYDWIELQKLHNNGLSIPQIEKHIGVSNTVINRAIKEGYIIRNPYKCKPLSESHKLILSEKMKLLHSKGEHPGWAHINSRLDRLSYPERFFKKVLINEGIYDKYHIEQQFIVSKYFLDFAFVDLKLNVEIDGQQHYRNEKNIENDRIRNEYLISKGWKVYRIAWSLMCKNAKEEINNFLLYLKNIDNETSRYYNIDDLLSEQKYNEEKRKKKYNKELYIEKQKKYIEKVINSDIDFSKFGWVRKVAVIINKQSQKVNSWMKKYMNDFYNEKCFKKLNQGTTLNN